LYGPFLQQAAVVAALAGRPGKPIVACVVLDEGDGRAQFARWADVLREVANCEPVPVLMSAGAPLDVSELGNADGLLVCGGLTPGYAASMASGAAEVLDWLLLGGRPYAGFSAGSAIAPELSLVGGWLSGGVPICSDDAAEDLDEITVQPGLGLVGFTVDVHCSKWGTLPRLIEAVRPRPGVSGVGIDENTALIVGPDGAFVAGRGQVWLVNSRGNGTVEVTPFRAGQRVPVPV
jgi:cyanophycinase